MARERQRHDYSDQPVESTTGGDFGDGNTPLLGRRSLLKLAGAGAAAMTVGAGTASAASYETIKVPAGSTKSFQIRDGDVFENKLLDVTANQTRVTLHAVGSNWTIRNIGIKGVHDQSGGHAVLDLYETGGDSVIENIWMGDGSSVYNGPGDSETAAWVDPRTSGNITFKNCYIANWKDNGIYASSVGRDGNGRIVIDSCYAANNNHADYRIGSSGSMVKNSSVEHTKSGATSRGVWCWHKDDLQVRNTQINMHGYGAAVNAGPIYPATVGLYDTEYKGPLVEDGRGSGTINLVSGDGTNPNVTVPDGVPTSAVQAASGSSGSTSTSTTTTTTQQSTSTASAHTLRIDTPKGGATVHYSFTTSGTIDPKKNTEAADSASQNPDGTWTATGVCGDGYVDSYGFDGKLLDVQHDTPMTVSVDGSSVDLSGFEPHRINVFGRGSVDYSFTTSGKIVPQGNTESSDSVRKNGDGSWTAKGYVGNGYVDSYEFDGLLTSFDNSDSVKLVVDGHTVDPSSL